MATTATVTLSDEEKQMILEVLGEYGEDLRSLGLGEPITEKLRSSGATTEFAPEEMEIILDALDVYADIFGAQEEPIVEKLVEGLNTLGRVWLPN